MPDYDGTITLSTPVKDLDASLGWFADKLGFEEMFRAPEAGWGGGKDACRGRQHWPQPRWGRVRNGHDARVRSSRHRRGSHRTGGKGRVVRGRHGGDSRHGQAGDLHRPRRQSLHARPIIGVTHRRYPVFLHLHRPTQTRGNVVHMPHACCPEERNSAGAFARARCERMLNRDGQEATPHRQLPTRDDRLVSCPLAPPRLLGSSSSGDRPRAGTPAWVPGLC